MSGDLLNNGEPIVVTTPRDRIGHGPWARLLVTEVVGNEGSKIAEHARELARGGNVHSASVDHGRIEAHVTDDDACDYHVALTADAIPPRIWTAVTRSARLNPRLAAAIEGREQSVHLEHLMRFDWSEPLVPRVGRACSCTKVGPCEHVAAVAYVFADLIDDDPSLLLRWRGCGSTGTDVPVIEMPAPDPVSDLVANLDDEPWQSGRLPAPRRLRPLPVGAVVKCLGPSGLPVAATDLADVLQRAYASLATSDSR